MNVEITKDNLMDAINTANLGIGNTSMSILKCFNISAIEDHLTVRGYDLTTYCEQSVECKVNESGEINVSAANLKQLISSCSGKLTIKQADNMAVVSGSNMEYKLQIADQEYPEVPNVEYSYSVSVDVLELTNMLESVVFCCDTSGTRPVLDAVFIEIDNGKLSVAATDARRLAVSATSVDTGDKQSCLISTSAALSLIGICKKRTDSVIVDVSETHVRFLFSDGTIMISHAIQGQFPNYRRVSNTGEATATYTLNSQTLMKKLNRIGIVAAQNNNKVTFDISNNIATLTATSPIVGSASEEMPADGVGDANFIMNYKMLIPMLKIAQSDIEVHFTAPLRPLKITMKDNNEKYYICMPMSEG